METLQIKKPNVLQAYKAANTEGKSLLSNLFGKEIFSQKITDRVKRFEDACAVLDIEYTEQIPGSCNPFASDTKSIQAYTKLIIIARALNEGWEPDWNDTNQYKYFPYFKMKPGFGFSITFYAYWRTLTTVGSRLCFKTAELAEYAGKQFEHIYDDFITL